MSMSNNRPPYQMKRVVHELPTAHDFGPADGCNSPDITLQRPGISSDGPYHLQRLSRQEHRSPRDDVSSRPPDRSPDLAYQQQQRQIQQQQNQNGGDDVRLMRPLLVTPNPTRPPILGRAGGNNNRGSAGYDPSEVYDLLTTRPKSVQQQQRRDSSSKPNNSNSSNNNDPSSFGRTQTVSGMSGGIARPIPVTPNAVVRVNTARVAPIHEESNDVGSVTTATTTTTTSGSRTSRGSFSSRISSRTSRRKNKVRVSVHTSDTVVDNSSSSASVASEPAAASSSSPGGAGNKIISRGRKKNRKNIVSGVPNQGSFREGAKNRFRNSSASVASESATSYASSHASSIVSAPATVFTSSAPPSVRLATLDSNSSTASIPSSRAAVNRSSNVNNNVDVTNGVAGGNGGGIPAASLTLIAAAFGPKADLYNDVLRISRQASEREIRTAYFRRGREVLSSPSTEGNENHHPNERKEDLGPMDEVSENDASSVGSFEGGNGGGGGASGKNNASSGGGAMAESKLKFQAVSVAYEILSTPELRREYDESLGITENVLGTSSGVGDIHVAGSALRPSGPPRRQGPNSDSGLQNTNQSLETAVLASKLVGGMRRSKSTSSLQEKAERAVSPSAIRTGSDNNNKTKNSVRWNEEVEELVIVDFDPNEHNHRRESNGTDADRNGKNDDRRQTKPGSNLENDGNNEELTALQKHLQHLDKAAEASEKKDMFDELERSVEELLSVGGSSASGGSTTKDVGGGGETTGGSKGSGSRSGSSNIRRLSASQNAKGGKPSSSSSSMKQRNGIKTKQGGGSSSRNGQRKGARNSSEESHRRGVGGDKTDRSYDFDAPSDIIFRQRRKKKRHRGGVRGSRRSSFSAGQRRIKEDNDNFMMTTPPPSNLNDDGSVTVMTSDSGSNYTIADTVSTLSMGSGGVRNLHRPPRPLEMVQEEQEGTTLPSSKPSTSAGPSDPTNEVSSSSSDKSSQHPPPLPSRPEKQTRDSPSSNEDDYDILRLMTRQQQHQQQQSDENGQTPTTTSPVPPASPPSSGSFTDDSLLEEDDDVEILSGTEEEEDEDDDDDEERGCDMQASDLLCGHAAREGRNPTASPSPDDEKRGKLCRVSFSDQSMEQEGEQPNNGSFTTKKKITTRTRLGGNESPSLSSSSTVTSRDTSNTWDDNPPMNFTQYMPQYVQTLLTECKESLCSHNELDTLRLKLSDMFVVRDSDWDQVVSIVKTEMGRNPTSAGAGGATGGVGTLVGSDALSCRPSFENECDDSSTTRIVDMENNLEVSSFDRR